MTGAIEMGTSKITGLGDPTANQDAATKNYVDTQDATKLSTTGGTMSGAIAMGTNKITGAGDPTAAQDVATKAYTDSILGSATSAAASATAAASSASAAATSESNASGSATTAASEATAAAGSATSAATSYDNFDDRYLGQKSSDPTLDNDGDALLTGALYFNTTSDAMKVYSGSAWVDVAPVATSVTASQISDYTGTAAELNYNDITTLGLTEASKTVTADANGVVTFDNGISEEYNAVTSTSNATTCNMQDGTNFSHVLTENTTFTFSNPAASGKVSSFTLKIVQDASASGFTVTWPAAVDWAAATAPTLTATASAVDYFVFITHDGGTTWYGFTAGQAMG
jgi:hypothetical protein